jgi:hypothetical protein
MKAGRLFAFAAAAVTLVAACTSNQTAAPAAPQVVAAAPVAPVAAVNGLRPAAAFAGIADARVRSMEMFQEAGKVIQSPRCLNCHPAGDRPLQGNAMTPHNPLVMRGPDNFGAVGMRCSTCHGTQNFEAGNGQSVPGSKNWHLAPLEMAWVGRTLGQICEQLKDPRRNGGKTMAQMVEHMAHDELVGWGWHPGSGRTPAPGTQQVFGELIQGWADAGAHCPAL